MSTGWSFLMIFSIGGICLLMGCAESAPPHYPTTTSNIRIKGLTLVAPPKPFSDDPMDAIQEVHANWVAIVPYAFSRPGESKVIYNTPRWQWWGETPAGARKTAEMAKAKGLHIMIKPQVWIPGAWTGTLQFESDEEWTEWLVGYQKYILEFAQLAEEVQADLFCMGTEMRSGINKQPDFWVRLIEEVRMVYSGPVTYAANWDDYQEVPFWNQLDYMGINAYFPLEQQKEPRVEQLVQSWSKWLEPMKEYQEAIQKPVLFTEFGYLSVDGAAWNTWDLEKDITQKPINQKAQANAIQALFQTFAAQDFWHGGFLWKWFPNMEGHEGYPERDYTPQGKLAEEVLKKWYMEHSR